MEDPSHVLLWSRSNGTSPGDECEISVLELPRLRNEFQDASRTSGRCSEIVESEFGRYVVCICHITREIEDHTKNITLEYILNSNFEQVRSYRVYRLVTIA